MFVEDAAGSRSPARETSYIDRYHLLCRKLVQEQLYTAAAPLASPRTAIKDGQFRTSDDLTSLGTFVTTFAGHIAAAAAR